MISDSQNSHHLSYIHTMKFIRKNNYTMSLYETVQFPIIKNVLYMASWVREHTCKESGQVNENKLKQSKCYPKRTCKWKVLEL